MGCRGWHYAITAAQRETLLGLAEDYDRIDCIHDLDRTLHHTFIQTTDQAWDAIHRCLTDYPPNTPYFYEVPPDSGRYDIPENHGTYPLKLCILGGRKIMDDERLWFIRLIEAHELVDLVAALDQIDETWLAEKYWKHCAGAWPEYGEDDLGYTWAWFDELRYFFRRIVPTGRSVIFTASQ